MVVITRIAVLILTVASLGLARSGTALAAALPNDDFANAAAISALPFSDSGDLNGTTAEPGEPTGCGGTQSQTIWYAFTPSASVAVSGDSNGSDSVIGVNIYTAAGSGLSGLSLVSCPGSDSFNFIAQAGVTYYFQVGAGFERTGPANFQFHLQQIPPPANDDFANATPVGTLPFTDTVDHPIAATIEADEPLPCQGGGQSGSVWWTFTPSVSGSYSASAGIGGFAATTLAAYRGTSLADLAQVGCAGTSSDLTFDATAGVTYFFRAFGSWNFAPDFPVGFTLEATPPPVANFGFQPSDPSIFDTIQFFDESSDPADVGIQSQAWDFGDKTTGTGSSPTHQYAADGDYTVKLTVTTTDGRTASTSQVIDVRTDDVSITAFTVPASAKTGKTIPVTVGVSDKRYPETVQVQLLKGNSRGGLDTVGILTLSVPVRSGKKSTPFAFSYTFTSGDAAIGKVTFEAIATIQGFRDTFPADNTAIASTKVR